MEGDINMDYKDFFGDAEHGYVVWIDCFGVKRIVEIEDLFKMFKQRIVDELQITTKMDK